MFAFINAQKEKLNRHAPVPDQTPTDAPCPFCGSEDVAYAILGTSRIGAEILQRFDCDSCGAAWSLYATPAEGRTLLNRRSPVPSGDTSDDTKRLDWLQRQYVGANFAYRVEEERTISVLIFEHPDTPVGADLRRTIDAARGLPTAPNASAPVSQSEPSKDQSPSDSPSSFAAAMRPEATP